jgi:hypothetical protein
MVGLVEMETQALSVRADEDFQESSANLSLTFVMANRAKIMESVVPVDRPMCVIVQEVLQAPTVNMTQWTSVHHHLVYMEESAKI